MQRLGEEGVIATGLAGATEPRPDLSRRALLGAGMAASLLGLAACSTPLPLGAPPERNETDAERLLRASAVAHGLTAYRGLNDINVRYEGEWRPLVDRIQPVVVDKGFRGRSEERLLPRERVVAQAYTGAAGHKQVAWQHANGTGAKAATGPGDIKVWLNDVPSTDAGILAASALVAEGYGMFLLGPLWLVDRGHAMRRGGTETVDGRRCDVVEAWLRPGLGLAALDRVAVCIDAETGLTRRLRFTLEGSVDTQGAVAEVDTFEHRSIAGVTWPMRSYERVVHPIRLPAHDWRITGLDVDRGYDRAAIDGPAFTGLAAAPARSI
ncbi:MAG: hypothetical protein ABI281_13110 [Caldimonas sp.]